MCEFDISSVKDVIFVSVRDGVFTQCKNSLKIAVIIQEKYIRLIFNSYISDDDLFQKSMRIIETN
jgi:hypothetical protein